jgi:hypothetical protein
MYTNKIQPLQAMQQTLRENGTVERTGPLRLPHPIPFNKKQRLWAVLEKVFAAT